MWKWPVAILAIPALCMALYWPVNRRLVRQAAKPKGIIGRIMTRIWSGHFMALNRWALSLVDPESYTTILDVGYGGGAGIRAMMERNAGCTVYGIDISESALAAASELNREHVAGGQAVLSVGDVASLPFDDNFFDLIVATQTHIYWEDLKAGLAQCHRVLRAGGSMLISCETVKIVYHLPEYERREDFAALLQEVGFLDVNIADTENYVAYIATK